MDRHYVYGEQGFSGNTGQVNPDLPDPYLLRTNGVGVHVVPGVGHLMMIEHPVATAKVWGRVLSLQVWSSPQPIKNPNQTNSNEARMADQHSLRTPPKKHAKRAIRDLALRKAIPTFQTFATELPCNFRLLR